MRERDNQGKSRGSTHSPKRKGMIVFLFLLIAIFFGITSVANQWRTDLLVERLDIRGCRILTEKELVALVNVPIGTALYRVDLLEVRSRLRANPYVSDAVVAHDLPSTIKITIQERIPVAILGGSEPFYVSGEGYILPPVNSKEIFDLPVVTGVSGSQPIKAGMRITSDNFQAAIQILTEAADLDTEDASGRELYRLISEINIDAGGPIVYTAEQGIPIYFAKGKIRKQLVYLLTFWDQCIRQQGAEQVRSIDLRFEEEVVVSWNRSAPREKSL